MFALKSSGKGAGAVSSRGGQSYAEYIVVIFFGLLILTSGSPSPVTQLMDAVKKWYGGYSYAMSRTTPHPDWINK